MSRWMLGGLMAWPIALVALVGAAALVPEVAAQEEPTFEVRLEPARATVGDHLTLTIVARHPPGTRLAGPDSFAPLQLIASPPQQIGDASGGEQETRLSYVLAAFQTGELRPPPLRITALDADDRETLFTLDAPSVTIESVLPPQGAELRDLKEPLSPSGGSPTWIWGALLMAGFVGLTVVTMALARLPVLKRPAPLSEPPEEPDVAARRELDAISQSELPAGGEVKEYYQRIASCLREYLARRFDMPAVAMTPKELASRLEALDIERWPARLAVNLLEQCEAAQFAEYAPARERAEADLASAYEVVTLTSRDGEEPGRREEPSDQP